jgi:hypothetical protein
MTDYTDQETISRLLKVNEQLIAERDAALADRVAYADRYGAELRATVERLTAERDEARATARQLILIDDERCGNTERLEDDLAAARQQLKEADEECHNQVARVVVEREALTQQVARLTEAIENAADSLFNIGRYDTDEISETLLVYLHRAKHPAAPDPVADAGKGRGEEEVEP